MVWEALTRCPFLLSRHLLVTNWFISRLELMTKEPSCIAFIFTHKTKGKMPLGTNILLGDVLWVRPREFFLTNYGYVLDYFLLVR